MLLISEYRLPQLSGPSAMTSHSATLAAFREINRRAGVDPKIVNLCVAYARQRLRAGSKVDFYKPIPSFEYLMEEACLRPDQRAALSELWESHRRIQIDERVTRLCIAYVGHLMLNGVAVVFDEMQLAHKLRLPYQTMFFMSSDKYKNSRGYHVHHIPKRGGRREINAPSANLKRVQRWILRNILENIDLHDTAHGFRQGRSIATNAEPHVGKDLVITLDLKNFFHAITFSRVLGIYLDLGYTYDVAILLTRLSTYKRRLPQGAPTSPALSNLACRRLDSRLSGLAARMGYNYTRYADDLILSASDPAARPEVAIRIAKCIISNEGFECAPGKVSIRRKGARQVVTGLTVNDYLNISRKYRKRIRAIIHNVLVYGLDSQNRENCPYFLEKLEGHVAFIASIDPAHGKKLRDELMKLKRKLGEAP